MKNQKFRGTTVALVTPFDLTGEIDEKALEKLIEWQIKEGTDVILAAGTTGEAATLSTEEHKYLMKRVLELVAGRKPVLCGTGSNSTKETIGLTQYAEEIGAAGALVVGPYYNKPTQNGYLAHFRTVAAETSLPVIIYNVPGRTGGNINAETTLRLAEVENIIGVKEASGNLSQIMEILRSRPEGFLVLSGDDSLTLPLMAVGADGVISVVANEVPRSLHEMVMAAFGGDWEQARWIHNRILPLMEINFIESNPIPVKTALAMMEMLNENFRLPLVPMTMTSREKLRAVLKELNLIE